MKKSKHTKTKRIAPGILGATLIAIFSGMIFALYPDFNLAVQSWRFYWGLSLPVILLGVFFYLLLRSKAKSIKTLTDQMQNIMEQDDIDRKISVQATGALFGLASNLNLFLEKIRARCVEFENQKEEIYTSNKILHYKKERLEVILKEAPFGILVMDESSTVTFANNKTEDLLGANNDEMIGHKFHEWSKDDKLSSFFARYQGGRLHRAEEMEYTPSHISDTTVSVSACPLDSHDNTASAFGTLVVCRDVTPETLAKQARGDFVAHVSHELKSPLNVLAMYSEMLLGKDGKSDDFRIEAVNVINDEVERLAMLINNLLSISKIEMGSISIERQRIKPLDLIKDAFDSVTRGSKEGEIAFKLDLPNEMSHIAADKDLLRVAINNLLTNAIKYNRPGGSVTVSAEESDDQIIFKVQDTGIGIGEEDLEKIFEKFYRSENEETRNKPGHGLGLTLAKNIIELHHGKLLVESELDKGTEFRVVFEKSLGLIREGL